MAIFGNLDIVKAQVNKERFAEAFAYLEHALISGSNVNKRLLALPLDAFVKIPLDAKNFGLEQVYNSKDRSQCFFESHQQYIDVQFILEGEEVIEVMNKDLLEITMPYSEEMDLIKYQDSTEASSLHLKKGDVAIFYPKDAHMPCLQVKETTKVVKTVVKVLV